MSWRLKDGKFNVMLNWPFVRGIRPCTVDSPHNNAGRVPISWRFMSVCCSYYAAEAEMRVTCGPSIVSTTIPTEWTPSLTPSTTTTAGTTTIATTISTPTVIVTASTTLEVDALGSEFRPGTIMTKEVSLPADGSMLNKNGKYYGKIQRPS